MDQQPSIGRVVHYQSYGTPGGKFLPEPRAAIITEVQEVPCGVGKDWLNETKTVVGLAVLNPSGLFFDRGIPFAEEPTPGHWNWPPRV
jgi:hypothetical protein